MQWTANPLRDNVSFQLDSLIGKPGMRYQVNFSAADGFVRIDVYEPITEDLQREFAARAIELANRHGVSSYLADVTRARNITGTVDQYQLAYNEMPPMGIRKLSRIAILADQSDESHDFIEILFSNTELLCQKFFSEDAAVEWLKSSGD